MLTEELRVCTVFTDCSVKKKESDGSTHQNRFWLASLKPSDDESPTEPGYAATTVDNFKDTALVKTRVRGVLAEKGSLMQTKLVKEVVSQLICTSIAPLTVRIIRPLANPTTAETSESGNKRKRKLLEQLTKDDLVSETRLSSAN